MTMMYNIFKFILKLNSKKFFIISRDSNNINPSTSTLWGFIGKDVTSMLPRESEIPEHCLNQLLQVADNQLDRVSPVLGILSKQSLLRTFPHCLAVGSANYLDCYWVRVLALCLYVRILKHGLNALDGSIPFLPAAVSVEGIVDFEVAVDGHFRLGANV